MKKMKLDCEALEVETFDTEETVREQGTVHGHATQLPTCPVQQSCGGEETCYDSCATCYTCPESCVLFLCTTPYC